MDAMTAIRTRRTHKFFTGDPVTREQLELLLELAVWAPNHHKTQPWRFFVVTHERIPAFADTVLEAITADSPPKMQAKKPALARSWSSSAPSSRSAGHRSPKIPRGTAKTTPPAAAPSTI